MHTQPQEKHSETAFANAMKKKIDNYRKRAAKNNSSKEMPLAQSAPKNSANTKPRARRGRPTKYSPEIVALICEGIAKGMPFKYAAARAGISQDTFCEWRTRYPEFSEAIKRAEADGMYANLKRIGQAASKGDTASAKWLLEHRYPEEFSRNRIEMKHEIEGQLKHQAIISLALLDQIAESREVYERERKHK